MKTKKKRGVEEGEIYIYIYEGPPLLGRKRRETGEELGQYCKVKNGLVNDNFDCNIRDLEYHHCFNARSFSVAASHVYVFGVLLADLVILDLVYTF